MLARTARTADKKQVLIDKVLPDVRRIILDAAWQLMPGDKSVSTYEDRLQAAGLLYAELQAMIGDIADFQEFTTYHVQPPEPIKRQRRPAYSRLCCLCNTRFATAAFDVWYCGETCQQAGQRFEGWALPRGGELIRLGQDAGELARQKQGYNRYSKVSDDSIPSTKTLTDLGITANQSSSWQAIASIPDNDFETYIDEQHQSGGRISTAGAVRRAGRHNINRAIDALAKRRGKPSCPQCGAFVQRHGAYCSVNCRTLHRTREKYRRVVSKTA